MKPNNKLRYHGKIVEKTPVFTGVRPNGQEWRRCDFVIMHPQGQFPAYTQLSAFGQLADIVNDKYEVGAEVTCRFAIDAKPYKTRWYNCLRIDSIAPYEEDYPSRRAEEARARAAAPAQAPAPAEPVDTEDMF